MFSTLAAEEEAKQLAERLKTEAGRERQRVILEHAEDIDEMSEFFRRCNLSKTTARKTATECICRGIATARKLAKLWARGETDLRDIGLG